MTRSEFYAFVNGVNLDDRSVRQRINSVVIDEVLDQQFVRQSWNVQGFAPLDTSCQKVLRPCPKVVFGASGWTIAFDGQWFCD